MSRVVRYAVLLLIATATAVVFYPHVERSVRAMRIVALPPATFLPVPVAGISPRALRDSWGAPRSGGRRHQGIDIFARRGMPVFATTPGVIVRVGGNRLGGNVVYVLGPGREVHYYAHLERFARIRAGDLVQTGDVLGYVGDTGNARGGPTHLHYGIYTWRGARNPFPSLARAGAGSRGTAS